MTRIQGKDVRLGWTFAIVAGLAFGSACGGGERRPAGGESSADRANPASAESAGAPSADTISQAGGGAGAAAPGKGTPAMIALGDSIFHGKAAGGTCFTCHGQNAKGGQLAPDLTDSKWLNGDGSMEFIVNTVRSGVAKPVQHPAPMPPMGGAQLTPEQVRAVAAYVYSLSHPA